MVFVPNPDVRDDSAASIQPLNRTEQDTSIPIPHNIRTNPPEYNDQIYFLNSIFLNFGEEYTPRNAAYFVARSALQNIMKHLHTNTVQPNL